MSTTSQFATTIRSFHVALQQHFEISLETIPLVMRVGKNRNVGRLYSAFSMPRKTGVQKGSVMSKNISPTVWLRLLRRNRAIAFGRYPSFFAASSIRFFVAGAM